MVHQSRHLARSCGVFFCCDFPQYCGQVHHRGREQGVSVALRTERQQSLGGALLARGRVPGEMNGRYRLMGEVRLFFCCNFPGCCGSVRHRGREQPAPRVSRTAGQKRPGGAFLGRGRVPGEINGRYRLTREVGLFFYCNFPGCCGSVHHRGRECPCEAK